MMQDEVVAMQAQFAEFKVRLPETTPRRRLLLRWGLLYVFYPTLWPLSQPSHCQSPSPTWVVTPYSCSSRSIL